MACLPDISLFRAPIAALALALTLSSPAVAGPLEEAGYALRRDRDADAARGAAAVIREDPTDLRAHRLWIAAGRHLWGAEAVVELYRGWLTESPGDGDRKVALATALAATGAKGAGACAEIGALTKGQASPPSRRYHALRTQVDAAHGCGWDEAALLDEIAGMATADLGGTVTIARAVRDRRWKPQLDALLEGILARDVGELGFFPTLPSIDGADKAQAIALAAARKAAKSEVPRELHAGVMYLRAAALTAEEDVVLDELAAAEARLALIDPDPRTGEADPMVAAIAKASKKPSPKAALKALIRLSKDQPEDSPWRPLLDGTILERAELQGDWDAALAACHRLVPTGHEGSLSRCGHLAAQRGKAADRAAVGAALVKAYDFARQAPLSDEAQRWEDGRIERAGLVCDAAAALAVLAWASADKALARQRATEALVYGQDPWARLVLGLTEVEGDDADQAAFHLGAALAALPGAEGPLVDEAAAALAALTPKTSLWRDPLRMGEAVDRASAATDSQALSGDRHPLVGAPFPLTKARGKSAEHDLIAGPVTVVAVWATWCAPCLDEIPHLEAFARRTASRGVRVVGLSVDSTPEVVDQFFAGEELPAYPLLWHGPEAQKLLRLDGIPATFVLDAKGTVRFVSSGFEGDLRPLERAVLAILADH